MEECRKIVVRGDEKENIVDSNVIVDAIEFHKTTYLNDEYEEEQVHVSFGSVHCLKK